MSIIDKQLDLESVPDQMLQQLGQGGDARFPQYLVLAEVQRRADMRQRYQAQEAKQQAANPPDIATQRLAELGGGIPGADPNMAPPDPSLQTGIAGPPPGGPPPMAAASGGLIPGYHEGHLIEEIGREIPHSHGPGTVHVETMEGIPGAVRYNLEDILEAERSGQETIGDRPAGFEEEEVSPLERYERGHKYLDFDPDPETGVVSFPEGISSDLYSRYLDAHTQMESEAREASEGWTPSEPPIDPSFPSGTPVPLEESYQRRIREAMGSGDDEKVGSELDAFNRLLEETGYGERPEGVDGTGRGDGDGYSSQGAYSRAAAEIEDAKNILQAYDPDLQKSDKLRQKIQRRKHEQARGIKGLADTREEEMRELLKRRLGVGERRTEELERLERIRAETAPDRFAAASLTKAGDVGRAAYGARDWSEVTDAMAEIGDTLRAEEDEALEGIYNQIVGDIGVEELGQKELYTHSSQTQKDWHDAENLLDTLDQTLAKEASDRGKAGVVEAMQSYVDLFALQAKEAGLDRRAIAQMENAMNMTRLNLANQAMDVTMHEPMQMMIRDMRMQYADNDAMLGKITQFENFLNQARLHSLWGQAEGTFMQPLSAVVEGRASAETPRPTNIGASGSPLPPTEEAVETFRESLG